MSCSDHIAPWGAAQGHSGFAWSWLDSALEATSTRDQLLLGCVDISKALLTGEEVTHDGLITVNQPLSVLREVFDTFREGGGDGKPIHLQVHLSWDPAEATAEAIAHEQWRTNVFDSSPAWNLEVPDQFDAAAVHVTPALQTDGGSTR